MSDRVQNTLLSQVLRWGMVLGILSLGLYGHYFYSDKPAAIKLAAWLFLVSGALFVARHTEQGDRFWQFLTDARLELKKVVWPSRQETGRATLMVLLMVVVVGIFFWMVDAFLLRAVGWITGFGS